MWLIFLKNYWKQAAIILSILFLCLGFSHLRYQAGWQANEVMHVKIEKALADKLQNEKDTHTADLLAANGVLASETSAKNKALAEASRIPKTLTKEITKVVKDGETCTDHDIGPDFERVWNSQSQAYSGSNKSVP